MMRTRFSMVVVVLALTSCSGLSKLDYTHIHSRVGWQLPDRVVQSLDLQPGDRVADIGSGAGYFLPYLAGAVGPEGRVYAVDVDEKVIRELEERVAEEGLSNVVVVPGEEGDPLLPDGQIDLVFLCNTYHHIEGRPTYFASLRTDLSDAGRVAVVDPNDDLRGVLRLFLDEGHTTSVDELIAEMEAAGYGRSGSFDFLPTQVFAIFSPDGDVH